MPLIWSRVEVCPVGEFHERASNSLSRQAMSSLYRTPPELLIGRDPACLSVPSLTGVFQAMSADDLLDQFLAESFG